MLLDTDCDGIEQVSDGVPELNQLKAKYSDVEFVAYKQGEELTSRMRDFDCSLFPSLTYTFGMVISECLALGVPVAAYPAPKLIDLIENSHKKTRFQEVSLIQFNFLRPFRGRIAQINLPHS